MTVKPLKKIVSYYIDRGKIYFNSGNFDLALDCYNKVVEMEPELGLAYYHVGQAQYKLNQLGEAKESFLKAVELDPTMAESCNKFVHAQNID